MSMVHCTPPENQIYSYSATSRSRIFRAPQCVHMAMALFRPAASLRPAEHGQLAEERLACGALDLALGIEQLLTPRALRRASGVMLFERRYNCVAEGSLFAVHAAAAPAAAVLHTLF